MELAEYYGLEGIPELSARLRYKSPEKLYRLGRDVKNKPSYDMIIDLTNEFESLNLNWLLKGEGNIVLGENSDLRQVAEEPATYQTEDKKLTQTLMGMFAKELTSQLEPTLKSQNKALVEIQKLLLKANIDNGLSDLENRIKATKTTAKSQE